MTLIRELIDIPTEVRRDAFVLKLTEGLAKAEETLRRYVVTPQLAKAFDEALGFIASAVEGRVSRAAYLHGSFGSGKSHFMAVLHLLLNGHPDARGIPRLQGVLGKHSALLGKRFLMVPYHMVGAASLEQALFDGYVRHVQRLRPDVPPPAVYRTDELFENAAATRRSMGDAAFFARLNEADAPEGGGDDPGEDDDLGKDDDLGDWGELAGGWDAAAFDAAVEAPPGDESRRKLLQDLVATHFSAFQGYAASHREALVGIDDGLAAISQHARELGYDGLVLFLDEVVLWLAARAADRVDINQEAQKLAKLVEAQNANRPVPIVSFLARQRKLSELVGEQMDGVERARLDASFAWNDGRFAELVLEDRNLPLIARERLLRPKDEQAAAAIEEAFARVARTRQQVLDRMLTSSDGVDAFRHVYPFTPALVQALVALSAALQRERTALRVMLMLLVEQRDRLTLGEVIPVGDLWDVISKGAEPFSAEMKSRFEAARQLYLEKLEPILVRQHGVAPDAADEGDPAGRAARNDARLLKTLLLSALVPQVESLRGLDAHKLYALNHGTIRSPIPGREATTVLGKVRTWASEVGEVRLTGDKSNPTIHIELSDVDVDALIESVNHVDTPGNRKRRIAQLVFEAFGMAYGREMVHWRKLVWRGAERQVEVVFANVRSVGDTTFELGGDDWRVVVDYPFDEVGHGPADDLARADEWLEKHPEGSRVLLWLPKFLGGGLQKALGTLYCIEHLLQGDTLDRVAGHLSPAKRSDARTQLDHRRSALTGRLANALGAAYGLQRAEPDMLDDAHAEHDRVFVSLEPSFRPEKPGTGDLGKGLDLLLAQALRHQFPAAPEIELRERDGTSRAVSAHMARKVWECCALAVVDANRRTIVAKKDRDEVKEIVEKLELGRVEDGPLVLDTRWRDRLEKRRLAEGIEAPSVGELRDWIDPADARTGLPEVLSDLIVLTYAAFTNRRFVVHGGPVDSGLEPGRLRGDYSLQTLDLPDEDIWQKARAVAESLFGLPSNRLCNGANVQALAKALRDAITPIRADAEACVRLLARRFAVIGEDRGDSRRHQLAAGLARLPRPAEFATGKALIERVAAIDVGPMQDAYVNEMPRLAEQKRALERDAEWAVFDRLRRIEGERAAQAGAVLGRLADVLRRSEFVEPIGPIIDALHPQALDLLMPPKPTATPEPEPEPPAEGTGWRSVARGVVSADRVDWQALRAEIERHLGRGAHRVVMQWSVERKDD